MPALRGALDYCSVSVKTPTAKKSSKTPYTYTAAVTCQAPQRLGPGCWGLRKHHKHVSFVTMAIINHQKDRHTTKNSPKIKGMTQILDFLIRICERYGFHLLFMCAVPNFRAVLHYLIQKLLVFKTSNSEQFLCDSSMIS
mgnify:CR=1 FL=1